MDMDKNELRVQVRKPDILIRDTPTSHVTSVSKDVVERIKAASWDEIRTVDDPGFRVIAMAIKYREGGTQ